MLLEFTGYNQSLANVHGRNVAKNVCNNEPNCGEGDASIKIRHGENKRANTEHNVDGCKEGSIATIHSIIKDIGKS